MGKRAAAAEEEEVEEPPKKSKRKVSDVADDSVKEAVFELPEGFEDPALDNDDGDPTQFSLSVGGLSFDTKRAVLKKAFKKFGTVVTVRRYVLGAPRRADITFSSAEELKAAIAGMDGHEIEGRKIKVKETPVAAAEGEKKKGKGKGKG